MRIFQEEKQYVHIEKEGRIEIYTNKCTNDKIDIRVEMIHHKHLYIYYYKHNKIDNRIYIIYIHIA